MAKPTPLAKLPHSRLMAEIIAVVSSEFQIPPSEIVVGSRRQEQMEARRYALYLMKRLVPRISHSTMARAFGYTTTGDVGRHLADIEYDAQRDERTRLTLLRLETAAMDAWTRHATYITF